MREFRVYILLFIVGITFFSCSKEDLEAEIPAYISIDKFTFTTDPTTQGTDSENITDAWVFIDDNLVGVYELPANFPVLKKGNVEIQVFAGIKENGISASRTRYLFYSGHTEQITLLENETVVINPTITYTAETKFEWIEDFESAGLTFSYSTGSDTVINKTNTDVFEGTNSGRAFLTTNMDFIEAISPLISGSTIRKSIGTTVFLELNFKTNEPVLVGLLADNDQAGLVYLNTTEEWKKIYINLTDAINSKPSATNFQVFFGIQETITTPFISANPEFFLDNIKLVHL